MSQTTPLGLVVLLPRALGSCDLRWSAQDLQETYRERCQIVFGCGQQALRVPGLRIAETASRARPAQRSEAGCKGRYVREQLAQAFGAVPWGTLCLRKERSEICAKKRTAAFLPRQAEVDAS